MQLWQHRQQPASTSGRQGPCHCPRLPAHSHSAPSAPELSRPHVTRQVNRRAVGALDSKSSVPEARNARLACRASFNGARLQSLTDSDLDHLVRAAQVADSAAGLTQPHPNAGCVLVSSDGRLLTETFQRAQGTEPAELQAVRQAGPAARGGTAYLNLETGDCHGDERAVQSLVQSGVARVVVGLRHPLPHLRGQALRSLAAAGVRADVLGEVPVLAEPQQEQAALSACLQVNEALLHRAVTGRPLGVLKYAMTLDGKIATSEGHSAWVSSALSRDVVFQTRARSDAVIVGGQTVRRDNPRLTTRRESGHAPMRIVMSRTLNLPKDANLWDVTSAPTIVMTQRGARAAFQAELRERGVEVVEFDFLTPEGVAAYCAGRGFLQCLWECGGTLAAPAIAAGVIHKALAFIAPKLIGGVRAPSPVGELGNVEMTQAISLVDTTWQGVGPDVLLTGYLPSSGGLRNLEASLATSSAVAQPDASTTSSTSSSAGSSANGAAPGGSSSVQAQTRPRRHKSQVASFYKAWDKYGAFSNFSPHPITMPADNDDAGSPEQQWASVEHYYQAQKFCGVQHREAREVVQRISAAPSPEEAARIGRYHERTSPHLLHPHWPTRKLDVMYTALIAKFRAHPGPRAMLLSTAAGEDGGVELVESSPHDFFWGSGLDGTGLNNLGRLLMRVRRELQASGAEASAASHQFDVATLR